MQAGAVPEDCGRVEMSDHLSETSRRFRPVAMVKFEVACRERVDQRNQPAEAAVVVAGHGNYFTMLAETSKKLAQRSNGCRIVDEVADQNKVRRPILFYQLKKPIPGRLHSPKRHQATGRPLAQLKAEVQIGDCQPFFPLMKKSEPRVEDNFRANLRANR